MSDNYATKEPLTKLFFEKLSEFGRFKEKEEIEIDGGILKIKYGNCREYLYKMLSWDHTTTKIEIGGCYFPDPKRFWRAWLTLKWEGKTWKPHRMVRGSCREFPADIYDHEVEGTLTW